MENFLSMTKGVGLLAAMAVVGVFVLVSPIVGAEPFYLGGIQVNEPSHDHWAKTLKQSGMNTVEVTVYAHQGDWDTDNLWYDETNEHVISEIQTAKKHGLRVVFILRVALDHAFERNHFLWHGMIMPKSDELVQGWFKRYTAFVLKWSEIAQREGVDVLGIASEMNSLTSTMPVTEVPSLERFYLDPVEQERHKARFLAHSKEIGAKHLWTRGDKKFASLKEYLDAESEVKKNWAERVSYVGTDNRVENINKRRKLLEQEWIRLIKAVRGVFKGKLTYASNFDQYEFVSFWSHLDLMGINAYFKLRGQLGDEADSGELFSQLEKSWTDVLGGVRNFRKAQGLTTMPIILTEIGYTFRKNCTVEPWAGDGFSVVNAKSGDQLVVWKEQPIDYSERAMAIRALRIAANKVEPGMVKGLLYWKLSTIEQHLEIEPFVHIIGEKGEPQLQKELVAFLK